MPYQEKKQQRAPEENKKARPEEQFVPEQRSFGMPNSLMQAVPMTPPSGAPNSVMREMEPEDSGALFRGRGFDPTVGAHELSHTVRREPAHGPVSLSVPSGTIQRSSSARGGWDANLREGNEPPLVLGDLRDEASSGDENDGFSIVSGGDITEDYHQQASALWAQDLHSYDKAAQKTGKANRKVAQAVAANIMENEKRNAKLKAALDSLAPQEQPHLSSSGDQKLFNKGSGDKRLDASTQDLSGMWSAYHGSSVAEQQKEEPSGLDKAVQKLNEAAAFFGNLFKRK